MGYIQKVSSAHNQWSSICFSEGQILQFLLNIQKSRAILWDGTEPNGIREERAMMFTLLTHSGNTETTKQGRVKKQPWTVAARLFSSCKDASAQRDLFNTLLHKAKLYCSSFSWKGFVLITDLDKMVNTTVTHYFYLKQLRDTVDRKTADRLVEELKKLLTTEYIGDNIKSPYYDLEGWVYLQREILYDLDCLCGWTVQHLPVEYISGHKL